ncbi:MAG: RnfABCDGE type electron transport complex subunit D [Gammaproteobacteria bacterium]|nr:RnfABCDGE type electron transport complex subunit D [Gammaproteobacteria bacterium]
MSKFKLIPNLSSSPHVRLGISVNQIMYQVIYALLPICAYAIYAFGLSVLLLIVCCVIVSILTESLFCKLARKSNTIADGSVIITGILLALCLPPGFPLWMAAVAAFISVALGKVLFGGLGYNVFNPALVGRAFVQAAFPSAIVTWTPPFLSGRFTELIPSTMTMPFMKPIAIDNWLSIKQTAMQSTAQVVDAFTGATPLALQKFEQIPTPWQDLLSGTVAGSSGETSAIIIVLCGLYLAVKKMLDWRIPVGVILGALCLSLPLWLWGDVLTDQPNYPNPLFVLFSGGLMLGAVFMASDMVSSPLTSRAVWIYAIFIGVLTVLIRFFGGLNEGVMYAILLANALVPLLSSISGTSVFGSGKK